MLLVPRHDGEYAERGHGRRRRRARPPARRRPGSDLHGLHRAVLGAAQTDPTASLRVEVDERPDEEPPPDADPRARDASTAPSSRRSSSFAAPMTASPTSCARSREPGALADTAAYAPDLSFDEEGRAARDGRRRRAARAGAAAPARAARRAPGSPAGSATTSSRAPQKQQREYVLRKQMESIRKELGEDDASVAEEYRAKIAEAGHARRRPRAGRARGSRRLERMGDQTRRVADDPHLSRLAARGAVGASAPRSSSTPSHAREVLDADHAGPRGRQGPDRRVPRRAQAAPGARHRRRPALRARS